MEILYNNTKVEKVLADSGILRKKVGLELGKKIKLRINQLESADNFNQYLTQIKLGKPHSLLGDLNKCYGISLTANYRLIVEPVAEELDIESLKKCTELIVKGVLEYHGGKNEWIIP